MRCLQFALSALSVKHSKPFRACQDCLEMRRLFLAGKMIKKVIVVPKRLVNLIVH
jgi:hypothetical protein